jgi:CO/xanthine dehydrogenase FAD-binding subunit
VAACAVIEAVDGHCRRASLALGGVAGAPLAMPEATQLLTGHPLAHERIANAAALVERMVDPPGDYRGTTEYRRTMAGVLSARALTQASGLWTSAEQ